MIETTYYKPPQGATIVLLLSSRPHRPGRLHRGARLDGVLMTPEACNLDQARNVEELGELGAVPFPEEVDRCDRCFPEAKGAA